MKDDIPVAVYLYDHEDSGYVGRLKRERVVGAVCAVGRVPVSLEESADLPTEGVVVGHLGPRTQCVTDHGLLHRSGQRLTICLSRGPISAEEWSHTNVADGDCRQVVLFVRRPSLLENSDHVLRQLVSLSLDEAIGIARGECGPFLPHENPFDDHADVHLRALYVLAEAYLAAHAGANGRLSRDCEVVDALREEADAVLVDMGWPTFMVAGGPVQERYLEALLDSAKAQEMRASLSRPEVWQSACPNETVFREEWPSRSDSCDAREHVRRLLKAVDEGSLTLEVVVPAAKALGEELKGRR